MTNSTGYSSDKKIIQTSAAPLPRGTYSQAVQCGNAVYFAGQIPLDPNTQALVGNDVKTQITQVFKNMQAVAKAAGGELKDIVKLNIYLIDLTEFTSVNEVMAEFFHEPYPARTTVGVAALPAGAKVEVEAVMVVS